MRILLLTEWFEPEPTFKGLTFAKALASRGHEVEVVTGFPNYPGGVVYPGYKIRPWQREMMDGIRVTRVAVYPSHDMSAMRRIMTYCSFALTTAILVPFLVQKPDVIYVFHPPASAGLAAILAKMFSRIPFIYDVQDMWPDTLPQTGMMSNKRVLAMVDWWCHMLYRHSARVVVPSQGFRNLLASRGVPQAKIEVIYNWCEESAMGKDVGHPAAVTGLEGRLTILYAGNMGTGQALAPVLDAARLCARDCPSAQFVFVGDGVEKVQLEDRARTLGLDNVSFMPRQPMSAMGPILLSADVLLVHLKRHPLFHITIPSKTQAYMVAGRPILMGVLGDAADLIRESGAGLVCEPGKPEDIARAVKQFAEMPVAQRAALGEAGTRFYRDHLSMAVGIEKFDRVFEEAVALSRPRRLSGNAR